MDACDGRLKANTIISNETHYLCTLTFLACLSVPEYRCQDTNSIPAVFLPVFDRTATEAGRE